MGGTHAWGDVLRASGVLPPLESGVIDEATLRLMMDGLPVLCWLARGDGHLVWFNRSAYDYTGRTHGEIEGWGWEKLHDPALLSDINARWQACIETGEPFEMTFPLRGADGAFRTFLTRITPLVDDTGAGARGFGVATDVSAQEASEAALAASRAEAKDVLNRIGEAYLVLGWDFHVKDINAEGLRISGRPREEIVGRHLLEVWPEAEAFPTWPAYQRAMKTRLAETLEYRHVAGSRDVWLDVRAYPVEAGLAILYHDITEKKCAQIALDEERARFEAIVESVDPMIWATDTKGNHLYFNRRWYEFTGKDPGTLWDETWPGLFHPDDEDRVRARFHASLVSGEPYECEYRLLNPKSGYRWLRARAKPVRNAQGEITVWYGVSVDIHDEKMAQAALSDVNGLLQARVVEETAERAKAEEALRQAQKMEAVGQLTGGIAHDFNNLLTGLSGSLSLLRSRLAEGRPEEADRHIAAAEAQARRAASLTHRLLAFSRRQTLDPKPTDVNRLVADMAELIDRTVGPQIHLKIITADEAWPVRVDPNQLENALLNLCINARDAMPDGGELTIETTNHWLEGADAQAQDLPPGAYLSLCVIDTGTGMPPDVVHRAFDPFFTTKPLGGGTGLGLSMVYGFARQSGGHVRIETEVGSGTTLCVYLPRHIGEVEEEPIPAARPAQAASQSGETVLIVDDEEIVRMVMVETLEDQGFAVLEAQDGETGLNILRSDRPISLLVTDVGLPGTLNGRQMADAARALRPDLKVLFITGYADAEVMARAGSEPDLEILPKPFELEVLAERVGQMLGSG